MKKINWKRIAGFLAVLAASALWLLFVIEVWEKGTATTLPIEVYYLTRWGNTPYVISAGLPIVAFCLIVAIPRTVKCLFPESTKWKSWYMGAAGILLAAQTVCMLPAVWWFVRLVGGFLNYRKQVAMVTMLACYVHAIVPALLICVVCWLICVSVGMRRAPERIARTVRQSTLRLACSAAIAFLFTVAALLILNVLTTYGVVNKGFIASHCIGNASSVGRARVSIIWAPVVEEIAFRGLICMGLAKYGRRWPAILISSVFFGMWHRNMSQFSYTAVWGIIWGYTILTTGSVFWSMLMHALSNLLAILAYSDSPGMVFGAWPVLCGFRAWLAELPLAVSILLLIVITAAIVLLLRCFRPGAETREKPDRLAASA